PKDIGKERPCLYYQIKQCGAPCQGYISEEEYKENFQKALEVLQGDYTGLIDMLTVKMQAASEKMEYEDAAEYRDLLQSVQRMSQKQKLTNQEMEDWDIIGIARTHSEAVIQIFFMRSGRMIGREHYFFEDIVQEENSELLENFVKQFYAGTPFIPREIFLPEEVAEQEILEAWLTKMRGQKVTFRLPKKGNKERLVELACNNASIVLQKDTDKIKREKERTIGAMQQIASILHLSEIHRVESYDISNISGFQSVGSMVVFVDGKPKKNNYRKFKIKTIDGPNDYGSMKEVLTRRFAHGLKEREKKQGEKFSQFPDLLLMDGGKGQVNVALEVLKEFNLSIPVCGMVKDDHHRTRGLYFNNEELPIDTRSEGFHLITRIQDETHRFAITFHRAVRSKEQVHSVLDDIPNIGEKRKKILLANFQSLEEIKSATIEELEQLPQINRKAAESIYTFFHSETIRD
ncbi:MAG: excinuclease ABC subunit UvrC, partial [Lachnospiraceae bacterium]|nr:excinuclease ABC subunit UvrC [Lachnospiraceae bacterium]